MTDGARGVFMLMYELMDFKGDEGESQREGSIAPTIDTVETVPESATVSEDVPEKSDPEDQSPALIERPLQVEVDLLSLPAAIGERGERPHRPYVLMMADARSGMIVGFEMMYPEPSLAEMRGQIVITVYAPPERPRRRGSPPVASL